MIHIYALVDPTGDKPEVHYIGHSVRPHNRLYDHWRWAREWKWSGRSNYRREKAEWMYNLLIQHHIFPDVVVIEQVATKKQARAREKHYIAHYRAHPKHRLYNLTAGGEG